MGEFREMCLGEGYKLGQTYASGSTTMRSRTRTALCVAILIVCLATPVLCTKKRKSLSDVDLAALEKEWEAGDDAAELEREYEHQMKIGKQKATPQTPFDSS
jgi:hypothetical protein